MAVKKTVKKRATFGKAWIQYCRYVRKQEGSWGWRRAHESDLMAGCAGEVMGDMAARLLESVSWFGKRMGDTKGGQRCLEIPASPSTMS